MKKLLLIVTSILFLISCESFLKNQSTKEKKDDTIFVSEKIGDITVKLSSFIDSTNPLPEHHFNKIEFLVNDSVPIFNHKLQKSSIVGYSNKTCTFYNDFFIFKTDDDPNPNKYLVFKNDKNTMNFYGETENVSGEIFGDIDHDGKFEIGGYTTYHNDTLLSRGKFINENIRVFELDKSIKRDKNVENKFFITIDSTQLAQIKHKVFDLGITLFEKDCSVGCDCDCGSGSIIFLDDNKFIENFYCMPDMDYYTGTYTYKNNKIDLRYKSRSLIYTPLNDVTFDEYELKVDSILTTRQNFNLLVCNDSTIIFKGKESYIKESSHMKYDDVIAQYKGNNVWNMLEIDGPYKNPK